MAETLPTWDTDNVESLRDFSRIRLIAADLDGTLLQTGSSGVYKTIGQLHRSLHYKYQVHLTLATGRTLAGVSPILREIWIPEGTPLILYNGSLVVLKKQNTQFDTKLKKTISVEAFHKILETAYSHEVRILVYFYEYPTQECLNPQATGEYVLGWSRIGRTEYEFNGMPVRWQDNLLLHNEYSPTAIIIDVSKDSKVAAILEEELSRINGISYTQSGPAYIEIKPENSNKGIALELVSELLHFSRDEVLAIGDNDNDSEMLAWSGIGTAVAGSSPTALASSDYVCRYGIAKGAIQVMRLVKHARRYYYKPMKDLVGNHNESH